MHLILALLVLGISVRADDLCDEEISEIIEGNLTDVYYNDSPVAQKGSRCRKKTSLTKCCPVGSVYYTKERKCYNVTQEIFNPVLYDEFLGPQSDRAVDLFHFNNGILNCTDKEIRFKISSYAERNKQEFRLRTDGNLYVEVPHNIPPWFLVRPDKYCIDNFVTINPDGTKTTQLDALVCQSAQVDNTNYVLSSTCMLISCVFILATVGVYAWLPKLHNIHGGVLIAYLMCLFVGFMFMATMQLLLRSNKITQMACVTCSIIIYFSLLSAFFWLNVMCFDIWRVFSGKREMRLQKLLVRSQLRAYAIYAFGIPLILTILLASLEFSGLPPNPLLPMLRYQGCFLSGKSKLIYLYVPIVVLCIANLVLFVLTALRIAKTKKDTSALNTRESSRHDHSDNTQTLFLYIKLFIVMGINWILEVISSFYPNGNWDFTDAYNVLIGLIIFIIFVCKRKIIQLLKERYKAVRREPGSQSNTAWSRSTSTKDEMALKSSCN